MKRRIFQGTCITAVALAMTLWAGPLALAQPSNDDISNATTFSTLPFSDGPIDTTSATTAADDPSCAGNGHSVWYAFTLSSDVTVEIDTFNSDYDTTLSAYTGSPGNLTQIACNDDAGDGVQSAIVFDAMGGTTYFIMAASFFDSPGGTLFLHADVPPPPLHIGLTVSSTGLVNPKTGVATVSGTITCNNDARYFIASELDQRIGRVARWAATSRAKASRRWRASLVGTEARPTASASRARAAIFARIESSSARGSATRAKGTTTGTIAGIGVAASHSWQFWATRALAAQRSCALW